MIFTWMLYSAVVALLLGVAAHLLEGAVRHRNWPIRGLWMGAVAGSLLLPALALLIPGESSPSPSTGVTYVESPAPEPVEAAPAPAPTPDPSRAPVGGPSVRVDLDPWLLGAWGIASVLMLCGFAASGLLLRSRSRSWVRSRLDGRDVWISADTGPAVVGFLRSRIVVPEWMVGHGEDEQRMILAHEEEHLRAGDSQLLLGTLFLLIALPWNAALWWQSRRLRQAVEVDCDRRVLARGFDARRYSRLLLEVSERGTAHRLMIAALSESPSGLERRIRRMLTRPPRRWMPRLSAAALAAVLLVVVACEIPRPTMPAPQSSLEAAIGQSVVMVDRPGPGDIIKATMLHHFPEEYGRAGQGDTLYLWFIARADGEVERVLLTDTAIVPERPDQLLAAVFPGEMQSAMHMSGAGSHFVASGPAGPAVWPGGPEVLQTHWWQRKATPPIDLDPHFMQHPGALSREATIEALFPDLYDQGIEKGSALWVAFDDSQKLYRAWIGPDFDAQRSHAPSAEAQRQEANRVRSQVDSHLAEMIPDFDYGNISRGGFISRRSGASRLVWIEETPATAR